MSRQIWNSFFPNRNDIEYLERRTHDAYMQYKVWKIALDKARYEKEANDRNRL